MRIAKFVGDLDSGFRLLNLKNDSLRKRFDGLKYDLKKVEEVVYDVTIRGLHSTKPVAEATEDLPKGDWDGMGSLGGDLHVLHHISVWFHVSKMLINNREHFL